MIPGQPDSSIPIQSLWIGSALSTMEVLSVTSFLKSGHAYHLYLYDEIANIPNGVEVRDANEILPRKQIFKYRRHDSYAGFANLFRYKLLLERGGYWVDTDVVCVRPFATDADYVFASERLKEPAGSEHTQSNNCVIKAPVGSPIMEFCYADAASRKRRKLKWGQTGPKLLTSAIKQFALEDQMVGPDEFCPINWWEWSQFVDGTHQPGRLEHSRAIHLYHEMWRRNGMDKDGRFDQDCIYEQLKESTLSPPTRAPGEA